MKSLLLTTAFCLLAGTATASTVALDAPATAKPQTMESPFVSTDIAMRRGDKIKCKGCTIIIIKREAE